MSIVGDSLYIDIDPDVDYRCASLYLGHGGERMYGIGIPRGILKQGGAFVFPLSAWAVHDDVSLSYQYLWHGEKPESVWCVLETRDTVWAEWMWYRVGDEYSLLKSRGFDEDRNQIDSLWHAVPDSLQETYDSIRIAYLCKGCRLPAWPEEDSVSTDESNGCFSDSLNFALQPIYVLPPGRERELTMRVY